MAVAFDANATADATANAVTSITTSALTIGGGSNTALVVQVAWTGAVTTPTVNWDQLGTPTALTLIVGATKTNTVMVSLYGLVAPVSGAKQLKAAWTTARDVCINGTSWTGVDQTGGATSFPHGAGASGTSALTTVTVTSATGNATMAVSAIVTNTISAVNNTQSFIDNAPANMSACGNRAAGAASVTLTGTVAGGTPVWAAAGTDILAFSGGAATFVPRNNYQAPILTQ